jgi:hypothetical protein
MPKNLSASNPRPFPELCEPEQAAALRPRDFCRPRRVGALSPIDTYYAYSEQLVVMGTDEILKAQPILGRLLVLAFVAGVESYIRHLLAGLVRVCPVCQRNADELTLTLGAIRYYEQELLALGLFENVSFADPKTLKTWTQKVTHFDCERDASLWAAIQSFENVCHLRHAAVHAMGELSSGNARQLGLTAAALPYVVEIGFPEVQNVASVCLNAVRGYNRALFEASIERWIAEGLLVGEWRNDRDGFQQLFPLFRSAGDNKVRDSAYVYHGRIRKLIAAAVARKAAGA